MAPESTMAGFCVKAKEVLAGPAGTRIIAGEVDGWVAHWGMLAPDGGGAISQHSTNAAKLRGGHFASQQ
jgi:hypothetical protein